MHNTIITPCVCQHEYQDSKYGQGMRVHNISQKKGEEEKHTCTACGRSFKGKTCVKAPTKG